MLGQHRTEPVVLALEELLTISIEDIKNKLLTSYDIATVTRLQGEAAAYKKILGDVRMTSFGVDNGNT